MSVSLSPGPSAGRTAREFWPWGAPVAWSLLLALALWWNVAHIRRTVADLARVAALSSFEKDVLYRQWGAGHGGVYVPITEKTPANPFLAHIPERDLTTPSGRRLTLVNPAYMTRQVHELAREQYRHRGHITSLRPIRPENAPDAWERRALEAFERGVSEFSSVELLEGKPHLRFMRPMKATAPCLKCHAAQGYKEGDIRGGISVAVPLRDYEAIVAPHQHAEFLAHGGIWGLGMVVYGFALSRLRQRRKERDEARAARQVELTQRRHAEEELRREHARAQSYLDTVEAVIVALDREGRIASINGKGCRLLGYAEEELLGRSWFATCLPQPEGTETTFPYFQRFLEGKGAEGTEYFENAVVTRTGEARQIAWHNALLRDEGGRITGTLSAGEDVTDRKRLEAEKTHLEESLIQAQKMEAIGTLAGGIAHDFNNILTPILAHGELALMQLPEGDPVRDDITGLLAATERATALVKQILAVSRKEEAGVAVAVNVGALVKETAKLLRASIPATIELRLEVDPACGPVLAEPSRLHQVILNLCTNASYAMAEKGGVLTLSLARDDSGGSRRVRLAVADTGHGIPAEVQDRIFEPYFTTKPVGRGSGLGLAVVHGIVTSLGGAVRVTSQVGEGATFEVWLPETERAAPRPVFPPELARGLGQRVLAVDDEPSVRDVLGRLLRSLGYRVTVCASGAEALETFRADPQAFDAVVTDYTMPGMTGMALAAELRALRPELPILLGTGFAEGVDEAAVEAAGLRGPLMKPYSTQGLGEALRALLG